MSGDGHSPTWPLITKWLVGTTMTLLVGVCGFLINQVLVVNAATLARQDRELVRLEAQITALKEYELTSLKFEMRRLADSIDKLGDRLRQQEITNHGRNN